MKHFENQDDRTDAFILLMLTILTLSGVLWFYPNGLPHWDLQFSPRVLTAVVQSSLVGALIYCLALAYFEHDASI